MSFFKKFLRTIIDVFSGFGSPGAQERLAKMLETVQEIITLAAPFVRLVAALTPTRSDQEIVGLALRYEVPLSAASAAAATSGTEPLTARQKEILLKEAALEMTRKHLHGRMIPDSLLDAGVQLAYLEFRAEKPTVLEKAEEKAGAAISPQQVP